MVAQAVFVRRVVFFYFLFDIMSTMLPSHVDVNTPRCIRHRRGELLGEFDAFLERRSYHTCREMKSSVNHLTNWWLYVRIGETSNSKHEAQFGETEFARYNNVPHLWVRAKQSIREEAVRLLVEFVKKMEIIEQHVHHHAGLINDMYTAVADFDGKYYGEEHITFSKGDVVVYVEAPIGISTEGWSYGISRGIMGWYPPTYVAR